MRTEMIWIVDHWPLGCRGFTPMLPIAVVSQTGAIIHHKAIVALVEDKLQRELRPITSCNDGANLI